MRIPTAPAAARAPAPRAALAAALALASLLAGCSASKEAFDEGFKREFEKSFAASCTTGAVQAGAPQARAERLCGCTAKDLVARHSSAELTRMSAALQAGGSAPEMLAAVERCRAQVGEP